MEKGKVLSGFLLQQSTDSASTMWGTIAAVRIAEDLGWVPPIVAPIHRRLAKSGAGGGVFSNFTSFPGFSGKRPEGGGMPRKGAPWWHSCACHGLASFALLKKHPSGLLMLGGRRPSGSGPLSEGSLVADGAGGLSGPGHGESPHGITRRVSMGKRGWY